MQLDLVKYFNKIMQGWGHDIYLQRKIFGVSHGVYGDAPNHAMEKKLYRFTVRHMYARKASLERIADSFPEGIVRDVDILYFFPGEANPKDGDRIYDNDVRYDGGETFLIDWALPMRGHGGKVVYWVAGVTRESPN